MPIDEPDQENKGTAKTRRTLREPGQRRVPRYKGTRSEPVKTFPSASSHRCFDYHHCDRPRRPSLWYGNGFDPKKANLDTWKPVPDRSSPFICREHPSVRCVSTLEEFLTKWRTKSSAGGGASKGATHPTSRGTSFRPFAYKPLESF